MKNEFEPAALLARSFLGQVALMSETMVVKSLSGHRSEVGHGAELLYSLSAWLVKASPKGVSLSEWTINRDVVRKNMSTYIDTHSFIFLNVCYDLTYVSQSTDSLPKSMLRCFHMED